MSSIGKIFVVVNLVLALLLLGSLGALLNASRSTADDVQRLEQELADSRAEMDQLRSDTDTRVRQVNSEKSRLEGENADLSVAKKNAERNAQKLELDNQQIRDDLSKLSASFDLLQQDMSAKEQRNRELADANDRLRTEAMDAKEAERQAEMARRALEDDIAAYETRVAALEDELTDTMDRAREAEMLVEVAQSAGFNPATVMATPAIDAVVEQVDNEVGFVILDKGQTDAVERGYTFDVFRGSEYLGQVRVDQVHPNHSTATITLGRGEMRRFDRATTRL